MSILAPARTPADFEAALNNTADVVETIKAGKFGDFVKDYAEQAMRNDETLMAQVREQVQLTIADMTGKGKSGKSPVNIAGSKLIAGKDSTRYNPNAPGAELDKLYNGKADWLQMNWHRASSLKNAEELESRVRDVRRISNSYSSVIPDAGGNLIPEEMRSEILANSLEDAVVRPRATVLPMSSLTLGVPAVDESTHSGSLYGGVVAYWTEEGAAMTESQASFQQIKLEAKKLTIYSEAPNELVADAPAFSAFLDMVLPKACAFYEDDAFIAGGNGVGIPLGALNANNGGLIAVTRTTSSTIKFQDIVNIYTRMLPSSLKTAVWMVSPDAVAKLISLVMPTGDATTTYVGAPLWLMNGNIASGLAGTILGIPVVISEKVAKLGSQGDIALVDWAQYLIGDRQAMTMTSSPHFKFSSDKTAYKLVERVDGRPWIQSAITPKNGSTNTLSAYVTLAA